MARSIKAAKPTVLFGISPFGIPRPGLPPGVVGFDQYEKLSADASALARQNGWADYYSPQLYWKVDAPGQPFRPLLDYWTLSRNATRKNISGPASRSARVNDRPNGYDPARNPPPGGHHPRNPGSHRPRLVQHENPPAATVEVWPTASGATPIPTARLWSPLPPGSKPRNRPPSSDRNATVAKSRQ